MTPEQAIAALPTLGGAQVVRQLADGPVAATWLLRRREAHWVLTIDKPVAGKLGLNRANEFRLLEQLAPQGLAPEPVAADTVRGLLTVTAIEGQALEFAEFRRPEVLSAVGRLLARLHRLQVPAPAVDLSAALRRYAGLAADPGARAIAEDAELLLATLPRSAALCLCHNDIHPANLIRRPDGEFSLVDWEYAGLTEPRYEFAVLAEHNGLAPAEVGGLLESYRAADGISLSQGDIAAWRPVYRAIQRLWQLAVENLNTHA